MGLRAWTKRQARKAKKVAKQAGKEIEKTAKDTGKAIEQTAKDAVHEAEALARKAEKVLEREIMNILDKAKDLANKAKGEVEELAKKAKREVEAAGKKAVREVEQGVTEKLPALMEAAAKKLAEEASKEAAKKALSLAIDIIEGTQPDTYTIIFGIELALVVQGEVTVSLELPNPVGRLSKIKAWAEKPPSGRAKIIECIADFGPESITAEAKVSGNGGAATWSGEKAYDALDSFLRKNGVN